jgi:hypothetical protein
MAAIVPVSHGRLGIRQPSELRTTLHHFVKHGGNADCLLVVNTLEIILGLVSVASFVIVVLGNIEHVNTIALALDGAALLAATARMALSLRKQRLSMSHASTWR